MPTDEKFDINALACEYGEHYKIEKRNGESDDVYRSRVAGELRKQSKIIEAHEAFSGRRYDDPEQESTGPMAGISGAVAQIMQEREYSPRDPNRQIGDDIAAGVLVQNGDNSTKEVLGAIFGLLGTSAGMDVLNAVSKNKK